MAEQIDFLARLHLEELIEAVNRQMDGLWKETGLHDWWVRNAPDTNSLCEALQCCPGRWDQTYVAFLNKHHEPEMARLYQEDVEEFQKRMEAGKKCFTPTLATTEAPPPPDWVGELRRSILETRLFTYLGSPWVSSTVWEGANEVWNIGLYVSATEAVGGRDDGLVTTHPFVLDLQTLRAFGKNEIALASGGRQPPGEGINRGLTPPARHYFRSLLAICSTTSAAACGTPWVSRTTLSTWLRFTSGVPGKATPSCSASSMNRPRKPSLSEETRSLSNPTVLACHRFARRSRQAMHVQGSGRPQGRPCNSPTADLSVENHGPVD